MSKKLVAAASLIAGALLSGCSGSGLKFEKMPGGYEDHIESKLVSSLAGRQVFMGAKSISFGSPPGRVFSDIEGYRVVRADFIYKDKEPVGFVKSHAYRDTDRDIIESERRILGECQWECIYEEVIWAKVPLDYIQAHTDAGFSLYFMSEDNRTEKFEITGPQASQLEHTVWNKTPR